MIFKPIGDRSMPFLWDIDGKLVLSKKKQLLEKNGLFYTIKRLCLCPLEGLFQLKNGILKTFKKVLYFTVKFFSVFVRNNFFLIFYCKNYSNGVLRSPDNSEALPVASSDSLKRGLEKNFFSKPDQDSRVQLPFIYNRENPYANSIDEIKTIYTTLLEEGYPFEEIGSIVPERPRSYSEERSFSSKQYTGMHNWIDSFAHTPIDSSQCVLVRSSKLEAICFESFIDNFKKNYPKLNISKNKIEMLSFCLENGNYNYFINFFINDVIELLKVLSQAVTDGVYAKAVELVVANTTFFLEIFVLFEPNFFMKICERIIDFLSFEMNNVFGVNLHRLKILIEIALSGCYSLKISEDKDIPRQVSQLDVNPFHMDMLGLSFSEAQLYYDGIILNRLVLEFFWDFNLEKETMHKFFYYLKCVNINNTDIDSAEYVVEKKNAEIYVKNFREKLLEIKKNLEGFYDYSLLGEKVVTYILKSIDNIIFNSFLDAEKNIKLLSDFVEKVKITLVNDIEKKMKQKRFLEIQDDATSLSKLLARFPLFYEKNKIYPDIEKIQLFCEKIAFYKLRIPSPFVFSYVKNFFLNIFSRKILNTKDLFVQIDFCLKKTRFLLEKIRIQL